MLKKDWPEDEPDRKDRKRRPHPHREKDTPHSRKHELSEDELKWTAMDLTPDPAEDTPVRPRS